MPNEAKFTPGPWTASNVAGTESRPIVIFGNGAMPTAPIAEQRANARLIAAAPEGYELAKYIRHLGDDGHSINEKLYEMARALIAKAEGRE